MAIQLRGHDLASLTEAGFQDALINTKVLLIFAESAVAGDGSDWNLEELRLLGDISISVPVTVYDNARHVAPEVHAEPGGSWITAASTASATSSSPHRRASMARKRPFQPARTAPTDPCSPYALTKLQGEQWGRLYARLHGLRFVALRFFSVWGPGQRPDLALEAFSRRILAGKSLIINGDGSQRRDLTHVSDVARAVELALRWPDPGSVVLNVGTGRNHSVLDMVDAAAKNAAALHFSGSNFTHFTPVLTNIDPHPADVPETLASPAAVWRELGWTPSVFFPNGPLSDVKKV